MAVHVTAARQAGFVKQFSVFTANRLGRLHELTGLLASHEVHVLALTILDSTDSAIIRLVSDDPEQARELFRQNDFAFTECDVVVVEMTLATDLTKLIAALLEAEININYLYSFIPHPRGRSLIALNVEDSEMAEKILQRHNFRVLRQTDISR